MQNIEDKTFWIAVKALLQNTNGDFLILRKSESEDVNPHDFDIPGGRVKRGEKLEEAIIRECKEECGLTITVQQVSRVRGFTKENLHLVGITFLASCLDTEQIVLSGEHTDFYRKSKREILEGDFPTRLKEEISTIK